MPRNGPPAARTNMQTPTESSIPTPKCPTCDVKMHLSVLMPRDDGGGEWRFSCPVCKTSVVVITNP
jgi:transposase-like protein